MSREAACGFSIAVIKDCHGKLLDRKFSAKWQVLLPNSEVRAGERRALCLPSADNKNKTPSADLFGRRGIFLRKQLTNELAYANLWVVRDEREKSPPPHTSLLSSPHFGFSNLSGHQNARGQASPLAPDPAVGIHAAGSFFAQKKRSAEKCSADRFLKNGGGYRVFRKRRKAALPSSLRL